MKSTWQDLPVLLRYPQLWKEYLFPRLLDRSWWLSGRLASAYRRTLLSRTRVVAVIGSLGKSTTTRAVSAALGYELPSWYQHSFKNASNAIGLRILETHPFESRIVVEVAIMRPGTMAPRANMLRPDIAVVTTVMSEHQEYLGTLEGTRAEKSEMVRVLPETGAAVLNGDDPNVLWMKDQTSAQVITYGFDAGNNIRAEDVALDWPRGMTFTLHAWGESRQVSTRLLGKHMVYPILAAVAVACVEGIDLDQAILALASLPPTVGRLQPIPLEDGTLVLRDDAKAGLESTEAALDLLAEIPEKRSGVVLGELFDLSGDPEPVYYRLGQRIAEFAEYAIFVGAVPAIQAYVDGARAGGLEQERIARVCSPFSETLLAVRELMEPGDVTLVKGASSRRLGQVSLVLEGRSVRCRRLECRWGIFCDYCPFLERGWD